MDVRILLWLCVRVIVQDTSLSVFILLGDLGRYLAATASSSIIYLYIFELIYKTSIGAELAMHHLLAISSIAW